MPANYAHHRFGRQVLEVMPPKAARTVRRFRQLYDVGLHGPDIFFYYNPFFSTETGELGHSTHMRTGTDFFTQTCEMLRREGSEGAMAYLYGLLAHYCLDSLCHPFVHQCDADGIAGHTELEVEFDRSLMAEDGISQPQTYSLSRCFRLTRGECVTVAGFYPPVTPGRISGALANTRFFVRFLADKHRGFVNTVTRTLGSGIHQQVMHTPANARCMHLNVPLRERYDAALAAYGPMLEALTAHLESGEDLGPDFEAIFG